MMIKDGVLNFEKFSQIPGLVHAVSTKKYGSMKNNGNFNERELCGFLNDLNIPREKLVLQKQTHSSNISFIENLSANLIDNNDGLICNDKGIFLGVVTADCLPLIFYDPVMNISGVAHGGYKGLLKKIVKNMISKFKEKGSDPKNIMAGIGPGIGGCCYDVASERVEEFREVFPGYEGFFRNEDGKYFLDLKKIALLNLLEEGLQENNIEDVKICTRESSDFFSYRRDGALQYGEFVTIIGDRA